mmetsp:Transcript_45244/g.142421  ORF Transcript_45244/g.142421 Transcript_45244/m.142421 type:complete len:299 (-) Transcript_45244:376-1272(-)
MHLSLASALFIVKHSVHLHCPGFGLNNSDKGTCPPFEFWLLSADFDVSLLSPRSCLSSSSISFDPVDSKPTSTFFVGHWKVVGTPLFLAISSYAFRLSAAFFAASPSASLLAAPPSSAFDTLLSSFFSSVLLLLAPNVKPPLDDFSPLEAPLDPNVKPGPAAVDVVVSVALAPKLNVEDPPVDAEVDPKPNEKPDEPPPAAGFELEADPNVKPEPLPPVPKLRPLLDPAFDVPNVKPDDALPPAAFSPPVAPGLGASQDMHLSLASALFIVKHSVHLHCPGFGLNNSDRGTKELPESF